MLVVLLVVCADLDTVYLRFSVGWVTDVLGLLLDLICFVDG